MNNNISKHFDSVAEDYDSVRSSTLLRYLVTKERRAILAALAPAKHEIILDAGCGEGFYSSAVKKAGAKPVGVDISAGMIARLRQKGIEGHVSDVCSFAYPRLFDKILCAGALEFTASPQTCLSHFAQSLKSSGTFILLFPRRTVFGMLYYFYHRMHGFRIHLFSPKKLAFSLKRAGFSSVTLLPSPNVLTGLLVAKK